jgi:hypothetical protein
LRPPTASSADIETAVDARLALKTAESCQAAIEDLTLRVTAIEQSSATKAEARSHRRTMVVTIVGTLGSLAVGVILWGLNVATTTKADAVKQSTENVRQKIEAAQEPNEAAYKRGVKEGAEAAIAQWQAEQEKKDLVLVPRSVLKSKTSGKP